jgi:hypothetical protein
VVLHFSRLRGKGLFRPPGPGQAQGPVSE